jgi:hypothetical protein
VKYKFEFYLINIHWIDGTFDPRDDLCVHGEVFVKINEEIISNNKDNFTISATGLYLLRSLKYDYEPYMYGNFLLPCCATGFWLEKDGKVCFSGCQNGIDLTIKHLSYNCVEIVSNNGSKVIIKEKKFKEIVFKFISAIELFYKISPKKKFSNKEEEQGYNAFWDEWYKLKNEYL